MDDHIQRALEIGLGFCIFVIGISAFMYYQISMNAYLTKAGNYEEKLVSYKAVVMTVPTNQVGVVTLYDVLTNNDSTPVYVNGVKVDKLMERENSYDGNQAIKAFLEGLSFTRYAVSYGVDGEGRVIATYYSGI